MEVSGKLIKDWMEKIKIWYGLHVPGQFLIIIFIL